MWKPNVLVLVTAVVLLFTGLGERDLWAPDEPRIGQVAEELRSFRHGASGLILLHLAGEPYSQKPPLYYWLAAVAGAPEGYVSEWAARVPSALAGVAVLILTLRLGMMLLGDRVATLGAALLLSTYSFAEISRRAQFDALLTLFELTALLAFWRWYRNVGSRRANLFVLHGAIGLAMMTKGPVGLLVPLLAFAFFLAWERRRRETSRLLPWWGLPISLGPSLAWLAGAAALAPQGFLADAVGTNLLGRFFAGTAHARPLYYYMYQFPIELLPWTVLLPLVWRIGRQRVFAAGGDPERRRAWRLLLCWVGAALLFFSLSSGKRGLYLLPTLPATSLLCAEAVLEALRGQTRLPRGLGVSALSLGVALIAGTLALVALPSLLELDVSPLLPLAIAAVVLCALAVDRGLVLRRQPGVARFAVIVCAVISLEWLAFTFLFPDWNTSLSPRSVAGAAAAVTAPDDEIGLVGNVASLAGIAYYSGRDVVHLGSADDIRCFLGRGGSTFVVQATKLDRIQSVTEPQIRSRARAAGRTWLVVSATSGDRPHERGREACPSTHPRLQEPRGTRQERDGTATGTARNPGAVQPVGGRANDDRALRSGSVTSRLDPPRQHDLV